MNMLTPTLVVMMLLASTDGCSDKQPKPKMTTSASENVYSWHVRSYLAPYGEEFTLDCSSHNTANLIIQLDNKCIQTVKINDTSIRTTQKPNLGEFIYTCVDEGCENPLDVFVDENCCRHPLVVYVEPAMAVTAAGIRSTQGTDQYREYFVSIGEFYDVFCSSNTPDSLRLRKTFGELSTDVINETTVVYHAYADRIEDRIFECIGDNESYQMVTVTTDFPPIAHEFKCVLYHWRRLECSWQSNSERHRFRLFYPEVRSDSDIDRDLMLCADDSGDRNVSCKWFNRYKGRGILNANRNCSLILQTCNDIYCNNQTFVMACNTITKLDVINDFKVLNTSSRGVFLAWRQPTFVGYSNFTYNVEYRLKVFGEKWRSTNITSESCDNYYNKCEYLLALPYPDMQYEARVSMRFSEAADSFLSEPASIYISTEPRETECQCNALRKPELSSLSNALCQVCVFREHTVKNSMALVKLKSNLKKKLDKIEKYTRILKDLDSVRGSI